jgi:hypothetical protein
MGGWFLADYIEFLVIISWRMVTERGSDSWPVSNAKVEGAQSLWDGGCPKAQIVYTYTFEGECYPGDYEKPFLSRSLAEDYSRQFVKDSSIVVRLKPGVPDKSIVREKDQSSSPL